MKVAMIGTGLMGCPMAKRLLAAGHEVTVFNRTREKALPLEAPGARLAADAREAVASAECAVLMVKDAGAIRDLLYKDGTLPNLAGRTLSQMSTIRAAESTALEKDVLAAGGDYLEAPVLGSVPQAREGKLIVMVGGTPSMLHFMR
jgi:3-hydroxyisobutyrate dehydrogenase